MAARRSDPSIKVPPKLPCVGLGPEVCLPWAERLLRSGHTLVLESGGIEILDASRTPPTHFGRKYLQANVFNRSKDYGLRDAILTHGITFTLKGNLPPYIVVQQNMESIADGFDTVHSELAKMRDRGWYKQCEDSLDKGILTLDCVPCWFNPNGAVPRALSDVWRRILDGYAPRMPEYVLNATALLAIPCEARLGAPPPPALAKLIGKILSMPSYRDTPFADRSRPISSVNAAAGMSESRAANRAQRALDSPTQPRVTSAQRRRPLPVRLDEQLRALPLEIAPGATYPPELKPFFADLMLTVAKLAYLSLILPDEHPPVVYSDDYKSMFHQFILAFGTRWMFHILALDPTEVASGNSASAALAIFAELCMGMGIGPASNYAQRFATELGDAYVELFHEQEAPYIAQLEKEVPAFAEYAAKRRELERTTGRRELLVLFLLVFTDDPVVVLLMGPRGERAVRALTLWHAHMGPDGANVMMGEPIKRHIGVHAPWIGGHILTVANLGYLDAHRMLRLQAPLVELLAGKLTVQEQKKLNGLLEHVAGMCALPRYAVSDMYEGLDLARKRLGREPEPAEILPLGARQRRAALKWLQHLGERSGASVFASVFEVRLPPCGVYYTLRGDAALKGTDHPAMSGGLYSFVWVYPLSELTKQLPIAALEFATQGFFYPTHSRPAATGTSRDPASRRRAGCSARPRRWAAREQAAQVHARAARRLGRLPEA